MDHTMSGQYRLTFDPLTGTFNMIRFPAIPVAGGVTVTSGVMTLPSGTQVEAQLEISVTAAGGVEVQQGSTILVL